MVKEAYHGPLEKVNDCCWRIPKSYKQGMRVDGLIFADEHLLTQIRNDQAQRLWSIYQTRLKEAARASAAGEPPPRDTGLPAAMPRESATG